MQVPLKHSWYKFNSFFNSNLFALIEFESFCLPFFIDSGFLESELCRLYSLLRMQTLHPWENKWLFALLDELKQPKTIGTKNRKVIRRYNVSSTCKKQECIANKDQNSPFNPFLLFTGVVNTESLVDTMEFQFVVYFTLFSSFSIRKLFHSLNCSRFSYCAFFMFYVILWLFFFAYKIALFSVASAPHQQRVSQDFIYFGRPSDGQL